MIKLCWLTYALSLNQVSTPLLSLDHPLRGPTGSERSSRKSKCEWQKKFCEFLVDFATKGYETPKEKELKGVQEKTKESAR